MLVYQNAAPAIGDVDLTAVCEYLRCLMMRNVASRGWILRGTSGRASLPGCIIASPSCPSRPPSSVDVTDQDYVFHWTRDAAITATELAAWPGQQRSQLDDYATFVQATQRNCPDYGFACFRVDATPRDGTDPMELRWSEQSDGPALRILSLVRAWPYLSAPGQAAAQSVIVNDVAYILNVFRAPTRNLWEETVGYSFFVRAVQRQSLITLLSDGPPAVLAAIDRNAAEAALTALGGMLDAHWDGALGRYVAVLQPSNPFGADLDTGTVMASVYGSVPCTDPRLLATASQVRRFFENEYTINAADAGAGLGPLIGRYPGDVYDGDWHLPNVGQPWALCSCNFAELYYNVALAVARAGSVPADPVSAPFFADVGVSGNSTVADASRRLRDAGDAILRAVLYHSDHLEISEQFDRESGYEKSVRNLSWSYASFLSAVRARTAAAATSAPVR